jgi:hypothetical protein
MKGWVLAVLVATLVAVACQNEGPHSPAPGAWLHGSKPVDPRVIETFGGAAHCGMQNSTFLVLGWPLGQDNSVARWYVRSPSDFLKRDLMGEFGTNVTPPNDAGYTGYHNSTFELWLAPSDQDVAAYIKTGGHFERWPRSQRDLMCI